MPAVWIEFDMDYNVKDHLKRVLDACEQHGSTLQVYDRVGPGGGNPMFVVEVPAGREQAHRLLTAVYGADPGDIDAHIRDASNWRGADHAVLP